jgi:type VI secretion system secreted protein Hcp
MSDSDIYDINRGIGLTESSDLRTRSANFYLEVASIPGGAKLKGQEGKIVLVDWSWGVLSPRDPGTGLSSGKRMHHPLVVVGKIDKSAPKFFDAIATNKNLASVKLHYWTAITKAEGASSEGSKEVYRMELTNCVVSKFSTFAHSDGSSYMEISFTYQKIEITWLDGGISGMDDWLAT